MRRDNWVRDAGVAGSNPATPTNYFYHSFFRAFSDCWRFPSSTADYLPETKHKHAFSRRNRRPRLAASPSIRGCRECRVLVAPAVSCARDGDRRTRAYRYSRSTPAFPAQWFDGLCRALVSTKSARMCERAVLTNRPSLDLIPFVLKGREPVGERGTDPVVFLNPNSCTGFEPEPSKEGSG